MDVSPRGVTGVHVAEAADYRVCLPGPEPVTLLTTEGGHVLGKELKHVPVIVSTVQVNNLYLLLIRQQMQLIANKKFHKL